MPVTSSIVPNYGPRGLQVKFSVVELTSNVAHAEAHGLS